MYMMDAEKMRTVPDFAKYIKEEVEDRRAGLGQGLWPFVVQRAD